MVSLHLLEHFKSDQHSVFEKLLGKRLSSDLELSNSFKPCRYKLKSLQSYSF